MQSFSNFKTGGTSSSRRDPKEHAPCSFLLSVTNPFCCNCNFSSIVAQRAVAQWLAGAETTSERSLGFFFCGNLWFCNL